MLNYFGSKKNLSALYDYFQFSNWNENRLVDLFGGGGSIVGNLRGVFDKRVWNDLYKPGYYFFKFIQDDFLTLLNTIKYISNEEARNYLYHIPTDNPRILAASFYIYSESCFNGNAGGNWDVGLSPGKSWSLSKLSKIRNSFRDVEILNLDFREVPRDPDTVFYADPPYNWDDRASKDSRSNSKFPRRRYFHEFTEQDHHDLRDYLRGSKFVVSHYQSNLYDFLYQDCKKIQLSDKEFIWVS